METVVKHCVIRGLVRIQPDEILSLVVIFDDGPEVCRVLEQLFDFILFSLFKYVCLYLVFGIPELADIELSLVPELRFETIHIDFNCVSYRACLAVLFLLINDHY